MSHRYMWITASFYWRWGKPYKLELYSGEPNDRATLTLPFLPRKKIPAISTYSSKAVVLVDPGRMSAALIASRERAAISVVFLPRLRGTFPLARSPFGAYAHTRESTQYWNRTHQERPAILLAVGWRSQYASQHASTVHHWVPSS